VTTERVCRSCTQRVEVAGGGEVGAEVGEHEPFMSLLVLEEPKHAG
jgi:hypothetical protein